MKLASDAYFVWELTPPKNPREGACFGEEPPSKVDDPWNIKEPPRQIGRRRLQMRMRALRGERAGAMVAALVFAVLSASVSGHAAHGVNLAHAARLLEVPLPTLKSTVRAAYRRKAAQTHPDAPSGDVELFREVTKAYESLISSAKRPVDAHDHHHHADRDMGTYGSGGYQTQPKSVWRTVLETATQRQQVDAQLAEQLEKRRQLSRDIMLLLRKGDGTALHKVQTELAKVNEACERLELRGYELSEQHMQLQEDYM